MFYLTHIFIMNHYFKSLGRIALITAVLIFVFLGLIFGYEHFTNLPRTDFPNWFKLISGILFWFILSGFAMFASRLLSLPAGTFWTAVLLCLVLFIAGFLGNIVMRVHLSLFEAKTSDVLAVAWFGVFVAHLVATTGWNYMERARRILELASDIQRSFIKWFSENLLLKFTPEERDEIIKHGKAHITVTFKEGSPDTPPLSRTGEQMKDDVLHDDGNPSPDQNKSQQATNTSPRYSGGHMEYDA